MDNIFAAVPDDLQSEIFEKLVESNDVSIERIVSKGHKSPETGWYDQARNEWVLLLKGKAILLFDDETSVTLSAGDYINIAAHKKHKVEWTDPELETIWLAVFY